MGRRPQIFHMERKPGVPTRVGDQIRHEHREREEARQKGPKELTRVLKKQKEQARQWGIQQTRHEKSRPKEIRRGVLNKEGLAQERRDQYRDNKRKEQELALQARPSAAQLSVQRWLQWREEQKEQVTGASQRNGPARTHTPDESVRNWLAFRKSRKELDDDVQTSRKRARDYDHGL